MKELFKEEPKNSEIRDDLVEAYFQVGRENQFIDRPEEALAAFREAEKLLKPMIEAAPNDHELQRDLAVAQFHISLLHVTLGHREQALAGFEEGVRRSRALAHADPSDLDSQDLLVQYLHCYGSLLEEMGRPEEALAAYEEARPIIERVLREVNPSESKWQGHRAGNAELIGNFHRRRDADSLASRGLALARSGHPAEAVKDYRQAIKVLEGLETIHSWPSTIIIWPATTPGWRNWPAHRVRVCRPPRARPSGTGRMECLRAAVAAGFRDLARIRTDTDLDPLRSRPDFRLLMMDLAFPDDPFAS